MDCHRESGGSPLLFAYIKSRRDKFPPAFGFTNLLSVERVFNAAGDGILVVYKPVASYSENHNSASSAEQGTGCLFYLRQMHR